MTPSPTFLSRCRFSNFSRWKLLGFLRATIAKEEVPMPATCFGEVKVHAVNKILLFAAIGNSETKPIIPRTANQR